MIVVTATLVTPLTYFEKNSSKLASHIGAENSIVLFVQLFFHFFPKLQVVTRLGHLYLCEDFIHIFLGGSSRNCPSWTVDWNAILNNWHAGSSRFGHCAVPFRPVHQSRNKEATYKTAHWILWFHLNFKNYIQLNMGGGWSYPISIPCCLYPIMSIHIHTCTHMIQG